MSSIDTATAPATCPVSGKAADRPLSEVSLLDPDISAHPLGYYAAMRRQDPVHYDEKLKMWLVSRFEDIWTVQRDPITYSVKHGYEEQYSKGFFEEFKEILERDGGGFFPDAIMSDPPYHTRIRKLMEAAFSAHRVRALEPAITDIVVDVINQFPKTGPVDVVKAFAMPITVRVICAQLGIDQYNAEKISRWSHAVTAQIGRMQDHAEMVENAKEICELQNFLIENVRDRQANPKEDMISDMVHARTDDEENPTLTFKEVVSLVRATMIAGNETTATAMANLFYILGTQPKVAELLKNSADDDRLMNRFVEELLRIEPPVRGLSRMATKEVELGGTLLPKGAHMLLMYASANDEEEVFACPRDFDMDRNNLGRHVAFGGGPHRCIGLSLARMELRVAAREVAKRLTDIKLEIAPEDITYVPTVATHSIAALPVSFSWR